MTEKWLDVLDRFRADVKCYAFIAGGAVRDLILDRPVKDVDIWVLNGDPGRIAEWVRYRGGCQTFNGDYLPECAQRGYALGAVHEVQIDGVVYNIIETTGTSCVHDVVNGFDFGICQAWLCPNTGRYVCLGSFHVDALRQTFTLVSAHAVERSIKRFNRLQEKYAGWTLVVPEWVTAQ